MKKMIRNGVFETNSSSAHSLVIDKRKNAKGKLIDDIQANTIQLENGEVYLRFEYGEYGWHGCPCMTVYTKLQYFLTSIGCCERRQRLILKVLDNYNLDGIFIGKIGQNVLRELKSVLYISKKELDESVANEIEFDTDFEFGYMEHQSAYLLDDVSVDTLYALLFNPNAIVYIENDNDALYAWEDHIALHQYIDEGNITPEMRETHKQAIAKLPYAPTGVNKNKIFSDMDVLLWLMYNDRKVSEDIAENYLKIHRY